MKHCLPPMNYLRPFEAVARLGNTILAGSELGRTHGAISKQVKLLEEWLGTPLFERQNGRMTLSGTGHHYFEVTTRALGLLEAVSKSIREQRDETRLRIKCSAMVARQWLIPRMQRYLDNHPDLDVDMGVCNHEQPPRATDFDIAIISEPVDWPDMEVTPLMPDLIFPIRRKCAAETALDDVLTNPLIRSSDKLANWDNFLSCPVRWRPRINRFRYVMDPDIAIACATSGYGLALARGHLIVDDIVSGRVENPIREAVQVDAAYWLVRPHAVQQIPAVQSFVRYLQSEAVISFSNVRRAAVQWTVRSESCNAISEPLTCAF